VIPPIGQPNYAKPPVVAKSLQAGSAEPNMDASKSIPFSGAFSVKPYMAEGRSYVPVASGFQQKTVESQPNARGYFSKQSLRAQFAGFALASSAQRLAAANKKQKAGSTALPSMVYSFQPVNGGNSQATSGNGALSKFSSALPAINPALTTQALLKVQAREAKPTQATKQPAFKGLPVPLEYTAHVLPYRALSPSVAENLKFGQQAIPNVLADELPLDTPNFVQFGDGSVKSLDKLTTLNRQQSPMQKSLANAANKVLTRFSGLKRLVQLSDDDMVVADRYQIPLANYEANGQRVKPLNLVRFGKQVVSLVKPTVTDAHNNVLASKTQTSLHKTRQYVEQVANQLENDVLFGSRLTRQPQQTALSHQPKAMVNKANPFATVGFNG
jgi:hypothetical protein